MEGREEVADVLAFPLATLRYMFFPFVLVVVFDRLGCMLAGEWMGYERWRSLRIGTLHSRSLRLTGRLSFLSEASLT